MEIRENAGQFTEIIVPISKKQFRKKRSRYLRLAEEYTCVFFGYNDAEVVCAVFAWEETLSSGMINNFCNDIIATNKN
jgi:hypothetical protein